uniref:tRNA/rRNA methyltransferase SpoU type domain-containing protein n=1 Tax=Arcella intermedia TaxID=1963864 RepID=A0A6B2LFC2_9EUKA
MVLENSNSFNQQAVIRTAEIFGIQNIWIVEPNVSRRAKKITRGTDKFLSIQTFQTNKECIDALKKEGRTIWAYHYKADGTSIPFGQSSIEIPSKLAIVLGNESECCSEELLGCADQFIHIPLFGFADSLTLSITAALVIQTFFTVCPQARGDLSQQEKDDLRKEWYQKLGSKSEKRREQYLSFLDNPPPPLEDLRREGEESRNYVRKKLKERIHQKELQFQQDNPT